MEHASRRRFLAMAGSLPMAAAAFGTQAIAQEAGWPKRVITIVVGFPPGSINDVISRAMAPVLSASLGQPVIVENKGGAGGTLGTRVVARAEPDGYTLMLGTSSQLVMNVPSYKKLDFSIENDLMPVALPRALQADAGRSQIRSGKQPEGADRTREGEAGRPQLRRQRHRRDRRISRWSASWAMRRSGCSRCITAAAVRRCRPPSPAKSRSCSTGR